MVLPAGITNVGEDGYAGDHFGAKVYGWFIPPVYNELRILYLLR